MSLISTYTVNELLKKEFPYIPSIVEGIISTEELILLTAPAKAGKSMLALDLAISVIQGNDFLRQFKTHKTNVLLIQTEIAEIHFKERIKSKDYKQSLDEANLILSSERIRLDEKASLESLKETIKHFKIGLLILDPFYTLHRGDENVAKEIAPILSDLRDLIREMHCACILVHHQGKKGEGSSNSQTGHKARGSSSFADVPDGSISISRCGSRTLKMSFEFRNRETPNPIELITDNGCNFRFASEDTNSEKDLGVLIADKLNLLETGATTRDIELFFEGTLKRSSSSVQKTIKSALERGLIVKVGGKTPQYYHPNWIPSPNEFVN